jgi:hypothetical protein
MQKQNKNEYDNLIDNYQYGGLRSQTNTRNLNDLAYKTTS